MSKRFSQFISWGCLTTIALLTVASLVAVFNIDWFSSIVKNNIGFNIYWNTVEQWQWYSLWALTLLNLSIGMLGLYFLHCAFANIATGELFNLNNSLNLRRFSALALIQVVAKPLYTAITSVLLSINHPAGEKMLSISFGSEQIMTLALAMILWVMSDLLVKGSDLQSENQQFI